MKIALAVACALPLASCAYTRNRWADLKDVFTATAGVGLGVGIHAGPLGTGLGGNIDLVGLQGGWVGVNEPGHFGSGCDLYLVGIGYEEGWMAPAVKDRGKSYDATCYVLALPEYQPGRRGNSPVPPRYTDLEVSVGLLGSLRLGFNPGEFLDLVLGFFTVDIFRDDIAELPVPETRAPPGGVAGRLDAETESG